MIVIGLVKVTDQTFPLGIERLSVFCFCSIISHNHQLVQMPQSLDRMFPSVFRDTSLYTVRNLSEVTKFNGMRVS